MVSVTMIRRFPHPILLLITLVFAACGGGSSGDEGAPAAVPDAGPLAAQAPTGRLPDGVRPRAYRLDLRLDPREDTFSGVVEIDVELDGPAQRIWLHGRGLEVSEVTATTADGGEVPGEYAEVIEPGVSAISFGEPLPAGDATLAIRYANEFDRNLAGLFKVVEQGESYALAKSESIQARSYLPSFDEPGFKATMDFTLTIPAGYHAIANSPVASRVPAGDGMERVTFAQTRPMPTYLLSLAVGPFDIVEREAIAPNAFRNEPVPLRGVARKGRGGDMSYVLDVTPRMLEIFETELERPYPFEKLDIVAAPQWPSGATELSAAITYREQYLLVGDEPAPGARLSLLRVHAHEIAHMWFGNLVTMPWWDDLWLKEGFATWATPVALTILEPDGGHDRNAAARAIGAMELDSLASTRAIREPITDNDDIRNAYDSITYSKSLGVIHMVDQYFGPERFRPALGRYIEAFADGIADSEDFYRVIGEETGTPELTDTFRTFVEQTGVPMLDVSLDCDAADGPLVTIAQSRYAPLGSPIADTHKQWTIPVCLGSSESRQCVLLTEAEQAVPLVARSCPDWLLPNAGGSGYYRWNLDEAGWLALVDAFEALSGVEAMSLVDSAFAAFEAGVLDEATLLAVLEASSERTERQVLTAPFSYLEDYRDRHFSPAARTAFRALAERLYRPVLERTAESANSEDRLLNYQLSRFMAETADDPAARAALRGRAHAFTGFGVAQDEDALPSDLYKSALTVAIQDSDPGFLPHLVAFRQELDDPRFEAASASAIGAVTNPDLIDDVHDLALGEALGPRETFDLIEEAMAEKTFRAEHWDWLRNNFAAVVERIPAQWRRRTPNFAENFCSDERLVELDALFARHGDLVPGHERNLAQTKEKIGLCAALADRGQALGAAIANLDAD